MTVTEPRKWIELHKPVWQFTCHACRAMSDCYDSKAKRDKEAQRHVCSPSVGELLAVLGELDHRGHRDEVAKAKRTVRRQRQRDGSVV